MSSATRTHEKSNQQWRFGWVWDAVANPEQGQSNRTARYKANERHHRRAYTGKELDQLLSLLDGLLRFLENLSFLACLLHWLCLFRCLFGFLRLLLCFCSCRLFCFCRLLYFRFFCFGLFSFCLRSLFCNCCCFCRCRLLGLCSVCGFRLFFFGCFRGLFCYRLGFCLCFQSFYFFFFGGHLGFCLFFFGSLLCLQFFVCCN